MDALHAYLEPISALQIAQLQLGSIEITGDDSASRLNTTAPSLVAKTKIYYDLIDLREKQKRND